MSVDGESVFLVIFRLAERLFALHLEAVERAVRVVDVTPLPGAPQIVVGAVDVEGRIVPVLDVCRRFGMPTREIELTDQLLLARCSSRTVALLVEGVAGVARRPRSEIVRVETVEPRTEYVEGILQLEDGMVLIHDLERFLSPDEQRVIATVMMDK